MREGSWGCGGPRGAERVDRALRESMQEGAKKRAESRPGGLSGSVTSHSEKTQARCYHSDGEPGARTARGRSLLVPHSAFTGGFPTTAESHVSGARTRPCLQACARSRAGVHHTRLGCAGAERLRKPAGTPAPALREQCDRCRKAPVFTCCPQARHADARCPPTRNGHCPHPLSRSNHRCPLALSQALGMAHLVFVSAQDGPNLCVPVVTAPQSSPWGI